MLCLPWQFFFDFPVANTVTSLSIQISLEYSLLGVSRFTVWPSSNNKKSFEAIVDESYLKSFKNITCLYLPILVILFIILSCLCRCIVYFVTFKVCRTSPRVFQFVCITASFSWEWTNFLEVRMARTFENIFVYILNILVTRLIMFLLFWEVQYHSISCLCKLFKEVPLLRTRRFYRHVVVFSRFTFKLLHATRPIYKDNLAGIMEEITSTKTVPVGHLSELTQV